MKADYRLEVTAHDYSNPDGVTSNGYCCERTRYQPPHCYTHDTCDSIFTFCLRNLYTPHDGNPVNCPLGRFQTRDEFGENYIIFDASFIERPGIPNPLVFTGSIWPVSKMYAHRILHYGINRDEI